MGDEIDGPTSRSPSRWLRVALGLAAVVVIVIGTVWATNFRSEERTIDPNREGDAAGVEVTIAVVESDSRAPLATMISTKGSLVARGPYEAAVPLQFSRDGGTTWSVSSLPDPTEIGPGSLARTAARWDLAEADGLVFVVGGAPEDSRTARRPILWVSADGGATFVAGAGVVDGVRSGRIRSIVETGGDLLALGSIRTGPVDRGRNEPAAWASANRGRTWQRFRPVGVGPTFADALAPSKGAVSAKGSVLALAGDSRTLVRSVDGGRQWEPVELGRGDGGAVGHLRVVGPLTFAHDLEQTWVSDDGGGSWRALGRAGPPDGATELIHGAVDVVDAGGNTWVAVADATDESDSGSSHIVRSTDRGRTWRDIDIDIDASCAVGIGGPSFGRPVQVGGALVATWMCASSTQDPNSRILVSVDRGRTWQRREIGRTGALEFGDLVAIDDRHAILPESVGSLTTGILVRVTVDG